MSRAKATAFIENEDKHRGNWTRYLYKIEVNDSRMYDILLHIGEGRLRIQDACEIIGTAARSETFKASPESTKAIKDLALRTHVKAALQTVCQAEVAVQNGVVRIKVTGQKLRKTSYTSPKLQTEIREKIAEDLALEISRALSGIPDIKDMVYDIDLPHYAD